MIICINAERVDAREANQMRVVLQADTTEEANTKPKTGETVEDIAAGVEFYAGSIMACLEDSKTYILNGQNEWIEWTA